MSADGAVRTVDVMANDQVMTLEPALAGAALAGIRVQLETAAFHLQQALEREARLRRQLERAGVSTSAIPTWSAVDAACASAARARAALVELEPRAHATAVAR
jgi:hypothetical protein